MVEMVIAVAITTMVAAAAVSGWIFNVRGERMNSTQTELDLDVRTSMELLKHDLRLSSLDKMYFYPPGPGPYAAISFPMAGDTNNDGLADMAPGGTNILWESTVIYHIWSGSPNELRKTVISPRDNALTDAQCQSQLASVVTNGSAAFTYGSANANTRTIFANLFTWNIWGKSATFDAYAPTLQRETAAFGSILLGPGSHTVQFTTIGKNSASTGYKIGVDTLTASPCGVEREAEAQLPVAAQSGATAASEYMAQGSWGGNYQLAFPAATIGAYFNLTIDNDRWEETNFRSMGALCNRTIVGFDPGLSPKDYIVQLAGSPGYPWGQQGNPDYFGWTPDVQTGTPTPWSDDSNSLTGCVVRTLIRGSALSANGGAIRYAGHWPLVVFSAASNTALHVEAAYIAEAADHTNATMNAATAGTPLLAIYSQYWIPRNSSVWFTTSSSYDIDPNKSYLITFLVDSDNGAGSLVWPETHAGATGCYILPGSSNPTAADAQAANWSSKPVTTSGNLYALTGIYLCYPTNGLFTSQIFDTKIDTPVYSTISWNADRPSGTSLKVKVRTGASLDMTDAPNWTNVTAFLTSPANITCGNKRYVQFQAILDPDTYAYNSSKLKDVTVKWTGATKVVDVSAVMTKGPNYGISQVTVDGNPLTKGLRVDLTIYKDLTGWGSTNKQVTSSMTTEVEPRNTRK